MPNVLWVFVGGGLGAVCRYLITLLLGVLVPSNLSWGTIVANLLGCFLIGVIFALTFRNMVPLGVKLFLMTGFLGGFTTFSSYALDGINLMLHNETPKMLVSMLLNNLGGFGLTLLGLWLGKQF